MTFKRLPSFLLATVRRMTHSHFTEAEVCVMKPGPRIGLQPDFHTIHRFLSVPKDVSSLGTFPQT